MHKIGCPLYLPPNEIHLWLVRLDRLRVNAGQTVLSCEEIDRLNRATSVNRRLELSAGRISLRHILSWYLDCHASDVPLLKDSKGRPFIEDRRIEFNVSHSQLWMLAGISSSVHLGVDLEVPRQRDLSLLEKKIFSQAEVEGWKVKSCDERVSYFYDVWTKKEAAAKLLGLGLELAFNEIETFKNMIERVGSTNVFPPIQFFSFHCPEFYAHVAFQSEGNVRIRPMGCLI